MDDSPVQRGFPLARTAALLTLGALVGGGTAVFLSPARGAIIAGACGFVWAVTVLSLFVVARFASHGPRAVAMAHFFGAGGRIGLCVIAGAIAVLRIGLAADAVLMGIAAVYFPLLMIESVCLARYVRGLYPVQKGAVR